MINKLTRTYDNGETFTIEQNDELPGGIDIKHNGKQIAHVLFSDILEMFGCY